MPSDHPEAKDDVYAWQLHITLLSWLGTSKKRFIGDLDPGPHVWNYVIYKYSMTVEVLNSNPSLGSILVHYTVNTNQGTWKYSLTFEKGDIVGHEYLPGSREHADFFWAPSKPSKLYFRNQPPNFDLAIVAEILDKDDWDVSGFSFPLLRFL
jgi:hypothetical protein